MKVVCIKEYKVAGEIKINKENVYTLKYSVNTVAGTIYRIEGVWFTEENDGSNEYFYDYFIPLSEWRDKQIDSILNE